MGDIKKHVTIKRVNHVWESDDGDTKICTGVDETGSEINLKLREYDNEMQLIGPRAKLSVYGKFTKFYSKAMRKWVDQFAAYAHHPHFEDPTGSDATCAFLVDLFSGHRFPRNLAARLVSELRDPVEVIMRNPYFCLLYKGVGFKRADALYLSLGKPRDAVKRQVLCGVYAIDTQGDGSIWHPRQRFFAPIQQTVAGSDVSLERALRLGVRARLIDRTTGFPGDDWDAEEWIAIKEHSDAEAFVAEACRNSIEPSGWGIVRQGRTSDHQFEQLKLATSSRLGLLIGGGGVGKTFCVAHLVSEMHHQKKEVCLAAPTGKAAVRMTEALTEEGVFGQAKTIHSLLAGPMGGNLPFDYYIIDEASMIDLTLMRRLLGSIHKEACVLFVGDPGQLSPVGPGAPFRDMIQVIPAKGELTQVRRNCGEIVRVGTQIRNRKLPKLHDRDQLDLDKKLNLVIVREQMVSKIRTAIMSEYRENLERFGVQGVQILASVNKNSELGCVAINEMIQEEFNQNDPIDGCKFRLGDKVMNTKNAWIRASKKDPGNPDAIRNKANALYVANGEMGMVEAIDDNTMEIRLQNPERVVIDFRRRIEDESDEEKTGSNWQLGYCVTVHKSQGSAWPAVIGILDPYFGASRITDQSLLYTMITRATSHTILIGDEEVAKKAVKQSNIWNRKTFLAERIDCELKAHDPVPF